jgi:hypothetical protein
MAATTIQQALESLSLQREYHIRQQALIREKQRRHLHAQQQKNVKDVSGHHMMLSKATSSVDDHVASSSSESDISNGDKRLYLRNLQESESLLHFLNNRVIRGKDFGPNREELTYRFEPKTDVVLVDKSDKIIMEELRCHNDALRNHILEFMKESEENHRQIAYLQRELDFSRKENRDMKDRFSKTERTPRNPTIPMQDSVHSETFYSMPMGLNLDNLPALELPPLEMPKFDFDSIKTVPEEEISSQ